MQFKFKEDFIEQYYSDNDFYALCNGYLNLHEILADPEQIKALEDARDLLETFFYQARYDAEVIGEM